MALPSEIIHGSPPFHLQEDEIAEGGLGELCSLSAEILVEWARRNEDAAALGYTRHQPIDGYPAMFVEGINWKKTGALGEGSVRGAGLSYAGERRKRRLSVAGQVVSIGPLERYIIAWDENEKGAEVGEETEGSEEGDEEDGEEGEEVDRVRRLVPKLSSRGEPMYKTIGTPTGTAARWNIKEAIVTVTDTYFTTEEPDMTVVGTELEPPEAPEPPPYIWGDYGEALRFNHPAGWVLDNREVDKIYDGLWAVTDTSGYYYPAIPD
jgi:hypothetical protein